MVISMAVPEDEDSIHDNGGDEEYKVREGLEAGPLSVSLFIGSFPRLN